MVLRSVIITLEMAQKEIPIESHPQLMEITRRILRGEPPSLIAKTVRPPLRPKQVSQYIAVSIRKAQNNADLLPELATSMNREFVRQELEEELARTSARRERWIEAAENDAQVDADGNVVNVMNHNALGRHDGNGLKAVELRARLAGLMNESAPASQVKVSVNFPNVQTQAEIIDV